MDSDWMDTAQALAPPHYADGTVCPWALHPHHDTELWQDEGVALRGFFTGTQLLCGPASGAVWLDDDDCGFCTVAMADGRIIRLHAEDSNIPVRTLFRAKGWHPVTVCTLGSGADAPAFGLGSDGRLWLWRDASLRLLATRFVCAWPSMRGWVLGLTPSGAVVRVGLEEPEAVEVASDFLWLSPDLFGVDRCGKVRDLGGGRGVLGRLHGSEMVAAAEWFETAARSFTS
jgi:hypothetical protein